MGRTWNSTERGPTRANPVIAVGILLHPIAARKVGQDNLLWKEGMGRGYFLNHIVHILILI